MIEFIKQNLYVIIVGVLGFVGLIVRLTPTKVDDKIFDIISRIFYVLFPNKKRND